LFYFQKGKISYFEHILCWILIELFFSSGNIFLCCDYIMPMQIMTEY
jgi:hypothetical protein